MKRKLLTMLTALALCLSLLPVGVLADGASLTDFTGEGTEENPYQISSNDDLAKLAEIVNGGEDCAGIYFKLMNDVGTITTVIGDSGNPFKGNFDGGNHTVTLAIEQKGQFAGLFGCISEYAKIQNVTTAGTVVLIGTEDTTFYVSGICGNSINSSLEYCRNAASVEYRGKSTDTSFVGGVCGYNSYSTIVNCHNSGELVDGYYIGGVCGQNNNGLLDACGNRGDILSGRIIGGVCGRNSVTTSNIGSEIRNCSNAGDIDIVVSYGGVTEVGGVCGDNADLVANCCNTGTVNITVTSGWYTCAGGVCGKGIEGSAVVNGYNSGNISVSSTSDIDTGSVVGSNNQAVNTFYNRDAYQNGTDGTGVTGLTDVQCRAFSGDDALVTRLNNCQIDPFERYPGFWNPWVLFSETPQMADAAAFWEAMGTTVYRDGRTGASLKAATDGATGEKVFVRTDSSGSTALMVRNFSTMRYDAKNSSYYTYIPLSETTGVRLCFTVQNGRITNIAYFTDEGTEPDGSFLPEKKSKTKTTYSITVTPGENGAVAADRKTAAKGRTVTLTVTPAEGFRTETLTVTDKGGKAVALTDRGDGTYTFSMPASKVTVAGTFEKLPCPMDESCPIDPFTDTANDKWWHDGIHFCLEKGLMNGFPGNLFRPDSDTTRAQIVTILWRLAGKPAAEAPVSFADVKAGQWYTEAVRWAASKEVVIGYSDTAFGPGDPITREQLASILYRYARSAGIDTDKATADVNTLSFDDVFTVSPWAGEGVRWCAAAGVLNGSDNKLNPGETATRGEASAMLQRFCENALN